MSDYDLIGACEANNHYCPGVLGGNTHEGNIFFYYCPGVLGGNTYDGGVTDQIAKIMGYGDYQIEIVTIYRVYYVEGLARNLFSVGQFCDSDLSKDEAPEFINKFLKMIQVRLNATAKNIRTDNGTEFVNQTLRSYYEDVGISHETSVVRTSQQNGVVKRRNRTIVEVASTMLIYANAPLFLWVEVVATNCYTQNRSLICFHHGKTPYELLHDRKLDLSYLHVFGALCYPTNDSEDLGKLKVKADVGIFFGYSPAKKAYRIYNRHTRRIMETIRVDFNELKAMASEQISSGPALHEMTHGTLNSGLVPQPPSSTPFVPPISNDWDTPLQPLFDEYFSPPPCVDHPVPEVVASESAVSTGTPSSTLVDQDAPSQSTSQTSQESPSHVIPLGAEEADHDIEVAHMDNNP
ncbi:retrovirus-related pol polyprotein from transposon TNT 1-94 [Tanacetum coccineum]